MQGQQKGKEKYIRIVLQVDKNIGTRSSEKLNKQTNGLQRMRQSEEDKSERQTISLRSHKMKDRKETEGMRLKGEVKSTNGAKLSP